MTFCKKSDTDTAAAELNYGVADRLGRVIGTRYRSTTVIFEAMTDEAVAAQRADNRHYGFWEREPGTFYSYTMQPTRDGRSHQADHTSKFFATIQERDAALEKALKDARKRAEAPAARLKA